MKKEHDYLSDIAEIRSMMERSSKFMSLSGWAGVLAGIYALTGAYIAHTYFRFRPAADLFSGEIASSVLLKLIILALGVLILSIGTAILLSYKRAIKKSENIWNESSRRMLGNMVIPLISGGILILFFVSMNIPGLLAPFSLIFYGLSLHSAGNFTFREIRYLGIIQIILGLIAVWYPEYGVFIWAAGFGLMHIVYGIYIHVKYER